jgi:biotin carboxyl carrier protein
MKMVCSPTALTAFLNQSLTYEQEMVISAPHAGVVGQLAVREGDSVDGSDLVCRIIKGDAK